VNAALGRVPSKPVFTTPVSALVPYQSAIRISLHLRFNANSTGTNLSITQTQLLNLMVANSTGASTATVASLINSIRVRRVRVVDVAGNLITFTWLGGNASGTAFQSEKTLTAVGAYGPAIIDSRPPKNSAASFFIGAGSSNAVMQLGVFTVSTTYVDLWVQVELGYGTTRAVTTTNGLTALTVAFNALDNASSGVKFPNVAPNSIL